MSQNSLLLAEFKDYCDTHPDQRFWQALKNWSGAKAIWRQVKGEPTDINDDRLEDTYYQY